MKKIICAFILILIISAPFAVRALDTKGIRIDPGLYPQGAVNFDTASESTDAYKTDAFRNEVVLRVTKIILGIAGIIAVYFIINNGFYLITSASRDEVITQYKKGLTWALLGLLFIILSYSIITFIMRLPFSADQPPV